MTQFNTHPDIPAIVERALALDPFISERLSLTMDLAAANGANGNPPLRMTELMNADDFNFLHDVYGIVRHMDRSTGAIGGCFVPRFAGERVADIPAPFTD